MKLTPHWNPKNKFCVLTVHYTADPDKATPEWKAKAQEGIPTKSWNREYEIAYDVYSGKPVYEDYQDLPEVHLREFDYVVGAQEFLFRGWDFGYHHPAVIVAWMNQFDQLCYHSEVLGENEGIKDFATRVLRMHAYMYPNAKWLDCCDPAGKQKSDKSEDTSIDILNSLGVYPSYKEGNRIDDGLEILRQRMMRRNDGKYGMMVHPECKILRDGFKGGYRYPEKKEGSPEKEEPLKDGYYDHIQDVARYIATNFLDVAPTGGSSVTSTTNEITQMGGTGYNEFF